MKATILEGDVFSRLPEIEPGSVDCVVTSPPYFALRSYLPKGHPLKHLELGSEPTVEAYIGRMVEVFRLVRECMSPWAVAFVNIGDSYASGETGRKDNGRLDRDRHKWREGMTDQAPRKERRSKQETGIPAGNLCLIPSRLALALQADGWVVRSVVCWVKPSPMPQSVAGWRYVKCRVKVKAPGKEREVKVAGTGGNHRSVASFKDDRSDSGRALSAEERPQWADCPGCKKCQPHGGLVLRRGSWRPTSSWEPILMLAKQAGYFADGESVKTPGITTEKEAQTKWAARRNGVGKGQQEGVYHDSKDVQPFANFTGMANLRDVWRSTLADMSKEELIALLEQQADNNLPDLWTISSEPLHEKHYAAFPSRLVELCLRAGTSAKGYCPVCGMPWVRVVKTTREPRGDKIGQRGPSDHHGQAGREWLDAETETLGWRPSCSHLDQEPRPGLCLDPFAGSGRTGLVARKLGLDFVGVELAPEYVQMARRLLHDDLPLFSDLPAE